jgi:hypothetical protein
MKLYKAVNGSDVEWSEGVYRILGVCLAFSCSVP